MNAGQSEGVPAAEDCEKKRPLGLFDSRLRQGEEDVTSGVALGGLIGGWLAIPAALVLARPLELPVLARVLLLGAVPGVLIGSFLGRALALSLKKRIKPEKRGTALYRFAPAFGAIELMWAAEFIVNPARHGRPFSIPCFTMYVACAIPMFVRYLGIRGVAAVSVALTVGLLGAVLWSGHYAALSAVAWPAMIAFIFFLAARKGIEVTYKGRIIRGEKLAGNRKPAAARNSAPTLQTVR
jgi:hypothetical protein